jgi:hypothetical protein
MKNLQILQERRILKSISISLYNRLEYTKILFDSLDKCFGIDEYKIIICIEPEDNTVIDLAQNFRKDQTEVYVNESKYGCQSNIFQCISRGFNLNPTFHIHLEDDTIPGKDCLKYFEWANKKYKEDQDIFNISAYVNSNNPMENCSNLPTDSILAVSRRPHFTPWGWATWIDRWNSIKKDWDFGYQYGGWDVNMAKRLRKNRYEIYPDISRIQNIGAKNGVHVDNESWHYNNHYNEYWIEKVNKYTEEFVEI